MPEAPRLMGRNGEIWRKYCRGMTQEELGDIYGISQQRVAAIISNVGDSIPQADRAKLIAEEVDFFRTLRVEALKLWDGKAAPLTAGAQGNFVIDPDNENEIVRDHSGRLAALARIETISARMHKLLGLEASQKVDLTIGEEAAAQRAAAEAAAHLHGGDPE